MTQFLSVPVQLQLGFVLMTLTAPRSQCGGCYAELCTSPGCGVAAGGLILVMWMSFLLGDISDERRVLGLCEALRGATARE